MKSAPAIPIQQQERQAVSIVKAALRLTVTTQLASATANINIAVPEPAMQRAAVNAADIMLSVFVRLTINGVTEVVSPIPAAATVILNPSRTLPRLEPVATIKIIIVALRLIRPTGLTTPARPVTTVRATRTAAVAVFLETVTGPNIAAVQEEIPCPVISLLPVLAVV